MTEEIRRRWVSLARSTFAFVLVCSFLPASAHFSAYAQEGSDDLMTLSLEELMEVEIVPIGILESHIHLKGQWMLGYQFMRMNMSTAGAARSDYMMQPQSMWMDMHMMMLMYGLTDDLTLMAMVPFQRSSMEMVDINGMRVSAGSEGVGDIALMGHYALIRRSKNYLIGGAGISIPTGSIEASQGSAADARKLGYGMQLGAGVPELGLDLSLVRQSDKLSAGAHVEGKWSLGQNRNGYRLGDRYHGGAWTTVKISSWLAPSIHLHVEHDLTITGSDSEIAAGMSPVNDPDNYGGTHVSLEPALTMYAPDGTLEGQRLTVKLDFPLAERSASHFLEKSWSLVTGWQWSF